MPLRFFRMLNNSEKCAQANKCFKNGACVLQTTLSACKWMFPFVERPCGASQSREDPVGAMSVFNWRRLTKSAIA